MKNGKNTGNNRIILMGSIERQIARKDGSTIDPIKILKTVLKAVAKKEHGTIVALLDKADATDQEVIDAWLESDKNRIAALESESMTFQDGYKKAKKEARSAFETELKDTFGIEEGSEGFELTGKDLVNHIVTSKVGEAAATGAGKKASELTEEEIKNLPGYRNIDKAFKKQIKDLEATHTAKLTEIEEGQKEESTFSKFSTSSLGLLKGMNPILPKSADVAKTQEANFLNALKADKKIRDNGDGTFSILDKEGNVAKDGHGQLVEWEDYVKDVAGKHFEFAASNGGQNAGNENGQQGGAGNGQQGAAAKATYPEGFLKPKNTDEYMAVLADPKVDTKVKSQYVAAYKAENSATGEA